MGEVSGLSPASQQAIQKYAESKVANQSGRAYSEIRLTYNKQTKEYQAHDYGAMSMRDKIAFKTGVSFGSAMQHVKATDPAVAKAMAQAVHKNQEKKTEDDAKKLCGDLKNTVEYRKKKGESDESIENDLMALLKNESENVKEVIYSKIENHEDFSVRQSLVVLSSNKELGMDEKIVRMGMMHGFDKIK